MPDPAFTPLVVPRVGEAPTDARGEAERARVRGYAAGFAEGRRIALEEHRAQHLIDQERLRAQEESSRRSVASGLETLRAAADELHRQTEALTAMAVDEIERLAVELAETILDAELSDPARSAAHALRRAVAEVPIDRWIRVSLNERDLSQLAAHESQLLDGIEAVAAGHVDAGGAVVEVPHGAVDTRVSRALARARSARAGVDDAAGASG